MKYSRLHRLLWRIPYRILHALFSPVSFINARLWMILLNWLLKTCGMKLKGQPRYITRTCHFDTLSEIELGDRVTISHDVWFLTHDYSVTIALIAAGKEMETDVATERSIRIGNNVFIGLRAIILPNTVIGDNVIIGAGAVVRGVIPPNTIALGNPAQVVGSIQDYAAKWMGKLDSPEVRWD
jgi:serine acetyltransferase